MYEAFFGLKVKPFFLLPDPDFIYPTKKHRMAMALLEYTLLNGAPFCVLTGEIGSGKTTLVQNLMQRLDQTFTAGVISHTHATIGELLQWILMAFDLEYRNKNKTECYQTLIDFLGQQYQQGKRTLLVVDEAQNLDLHTLEELRMLSNINIGQQHVLQIILVGQPQLRTKMQDPSLEQFAQRIALCYHLESLSREETGEYIRSRLQKAGAGRDIFTEEAIDVIQRETEGIPRLVNIVCDLSLLFAYTEENDLVTADEVTEAIRMESINGLLPLRKKTPKGKETGN